MVNYTKVKMNDKKQELYQITWKQDYPNWGVSLDELDELMLQSSDMTEAKEVINRIKGM